MSRELLTRAKASNSPFAVLKIYVPDHLRSKYTEVIESHNEKMEKSLFPDAGFDLYMPDEYTFVDAKAFIDFAVKCEMQTYVGLEGYDSGIANILPTGFYLYPRSSISKKPLLMANSVGIIDSSYRGNIMACFRYINENVPVKEYKKGYKVEKYDRLVQIVHPSMFRIFVEMVNNEGDLSSTERGSGGFGSTGA